QPASTLRTMNHRDGRADRERSIARRVVTTTTVRAMLAYIFWHRPHPNTERQRYEQAIVRFQNDLAGSKPPGFIGATSFQIEAVPWLSDLPGYEDWYLLDGTWAIDPLNAFAISGHVQAPTTA